MLLFLNKTIVSLYLKASLFSDSPGSTLLPHPAGSSPADSCTSNTSWAQRYRSGFVPPSWLNEGHLSKGFQDQVISECTDPSKRFSYCQRSQCPLHSSHPKLLFHSPTQENIPAAQTTQGRATCFVSKLRTRDLCASWW